jgi:hypothetical protein
MPRPHPDDQSHARWKRRSEKPRLRPEAEPNLTRRWQMYKKADRDAKLRVVVAVMLLGNIALGLALVLTDSFGLDLPAPNPSTGPIAVSPSPRTVSPGTPNAGLPSMAPTEAEPTKTGSPTSTKVGPPTGAPTPSALRSQGSEPGPEQSEYINSVNVDRSTLYVGRASAELYSFAEVQRPFPLDVLVCGPAAPECSELERPGSLAAGAPAPEAAGNRAVVPAPRGKRSPLGAVKVGGRVRTELTTFERDLEISPTSSAIQTISTAEDVAEWRWTILPKRSGNFTIHISITTLKGDTEDALYPTRNFDVALKVRDTVSSHTNRIVDGLGNFLKEPAGGVAALLTVLAAFLGLRQRRNRKDEQTRTSTVATNASVASNGHGSVDTERASPPESKRPRPAIPRDPAGQRRSKRGSGK